MSKLIGNAIVGQSGGPTAAINATLAGVVRGVLENVHDGKIPTLYGMRNGVEGLLKEDIVNLSEFFEDANKIDILEQTPAAALGSCRKKLPKIEEDRATYEKLIAIFKKYDIRYFFYIGGNDSMDTVAKLSEFTKECDYEMRVIGVPKTIDNDLVVTDHTPGFASAAKYIATTIAECIRDCAVYKTKAVTVIEIMGRDAGWLTASSGIAKAFGGETPDLIYLPERAFNKEEFFEDLRKILDVKPNVVVAVSEGIRFANGTYVCEGFGIASTDVFGHKQLSGTGKALEHAIKNELGCKVRSVELNIVQRCAAHIVSKTDIEESVLVGKSAVKTASEGVSREMMTIERVSTSPYKVEISHRDVSEIANKVKHVPSQFINERGNHITNECAFYLLPLIQGELDVKYENGIPKHIVI